MSPIAAYAVVFELVSKLHSARTYQELTWTCSCSGFGVDILAKHTVHFVINVHSLSPFYPSSWIKFATGGWDFIKVILNRLNIITSLIVFGISSSKFSSKFRKWDFSFISTFYITKGHILPLPLKQYKQDRVRTRQILYLN